MMLNPELVRFRSAEEWSRWCDFQNWITQHYGRAPMPVRESMWKRFKAGWVVVVRDCTK